MKRLIFPALLVGMFVGVAGYAQATDGDHDVPVHWIDTGDRAPRVIAFCFGEDAIYQTGDSDGIAVAVNSPNCNEGNLLRKDP